MASSTKTDGLTGWIKLHRTILNSTVFANEKKLKVFIWCLCKAATKSHEVRYGNQVITLHRGQFITGRNTAAEELGMSPSAVRRWLCGLQDGQQILLSANNKYTLVTVVNYGLYQNKCVSSGQQSGQQNLLSADNKVDTTKEELLKKDLRRKEGADAPVPSEPVKPEGWDEAEWH